MDASTRILRGLAVAELALGLAATAASFCLWDSLPPTLRDYEPVESELFESMLPGIGLAFALLPLAIAASFGVLLLWRPARLLYTATAAAGIAITPLFGPTVEPTWVGPLYDLGMMNSGAILALLYLSPAARHFGRAPLEPADAPARPGTRLSRLALFGGGLAIGVLAGAGALVSASVWFGYSIYRASENAAAEGRSFGASATDSACLEEARRRVASSFSETFGGTSFFSECLSAAESTDAFCREVPPYEGAQSWSATRCEGDPQLDDCRSLFEAVQHHCHPSGASL
jgi:hypothetical protein